MAWSILYLHGVGHGVHTDRWWDALVAQLESRGVDDIPEFGSPRVIRPTYTDLLVGSPVPRVDEPPRTRKPEGDEEERLVRRALYGRRQAEAIAELPDVREGAGIAVPGLNRMDPAGLPGWVSDELVHAQRYLRDKALRSAILQRVLQETGKQRDLVMVGHSLGSFVAMDFLAHLPPRLKVRRLVTIGSPLGSEGMFRQRPEALLERFPYEQVDGWVNVLCPHDPITGGRGLAPLFPAAVDVRISLQGIAHAAHRYLAAPAVGRVIADAVQPTVRPAPSTTRLPSVPLSQQEQEAMDSLRFSQLVKQRLGNGDRARRFDRALGEVQIKVAAELLRVRRENDAPAPSELLDLLEGRSPRMGSTQFDSRRWTPDRQLLAAIIHGTTNPIAPYEVKAEEAQVAAVHDYWVKLGYTQTDAKKVRDALDAASDVFEGGRNKVLIGALGLALLAAGPIGLVAAAPAGLAGGAAITAALAAFGPGGMVGGLALAGTLVSAGSSMLGAVASPSAMSPGMLQTQAVRHMAFALAQRDLDLGGDADAAWRLLNHWHSTVAAEAATHTGISDDNSSVMRDLETKRKMLNAALKWMVRKDLAPLLAPGSEPADHGRTLSGPR